jgi:hypothetical protein
VRQSVKIAVAAVLSAVTMATTAVAKTSSIAAPDNVSLNSSGADITVSWSAPQIYGIDQYEIQLVKTNADGSTHSSVKSQKLDAGEGTTADFTVGARGYYTARVRAKDVGNDWSSWSGYADNIVAVYTEDVNGGSPRVSTAGSSKGPGVSSSSATGISSHGTQQGPGITGTASRSSNGQSINSSGIGNGWSSATVTSRHVVANTYQSTGWQTDAQGRWYLDNDGTYPVSTWRRIGDKNYHFNEYGYIDWNRWILESNGSWYFCKADAEMALGWNLINDRWYYMNPANGQMYTEGQHTIDGKTYYMDANGAMVSDTWIGGHYYGRDGARAN